MTNDETCKYCRGSKELDDQLARIADLETSVLYLFRDQTYRGRCVLALKNHKTELFQFTDDELAAFGRDAARSAGAIFKAFSPDKINYAVYGDLTPHFHVHLVPKYREGAAWGRAFELMPERFRSLPEEELQATIDRIREELRYDPY